MAVEYTPIERMEETECPFHDVEDGTIDHQNLNLLSLNPQSTASDVRDVAKRIKGDYLHRIVLQDTVDALGWALTKTRDCVDPKELEEYLLFGWTFQEIRWGRNR